MPLTPAISAAFNVLARIQGVLTGTLPGPSLSATGTSVTPVFELYGEWSGVELTGGRTMTALTGSSNAISVTGARR